MSITLNNILSLKRKDIKRSSWIFFSALNNFSPSFFNLLLATILIKKTSFDLWGHYVSFSLFTSLSFFILGFGNKDYLLREFSRAPSDLTKAWQSNFIQRLVFAILLSLLFLLFFSNHFSANAVILVAWVISAFLYKSLDVLIVYKRFFLFSSVLEILGFLAITIIIYIYPAQNFTIDILFLILALVTLVKFLISAYYLKLKIFPLKEILNIKLKGNTLFLSLPYFLPSLIGLLQGKTDLYCVAYFLSSIELGKYQIFMSLLTIPHSIAATIVMPFVKNIYRLPLKTLKKITTILTVIGVIGSLPSMVTIFFIVKLYYDISLSKWMYLLGYFQLIPLFIYFIKINQLFKYNKQYVVTYITLLTGLVSFFLSIIFIPIYNIEGAMIANTITQWITLLLFIIAENYYINNGK